MVVQSRCFPRHPCRTRSKARCAETSLIAFKEGMKGTEHVGMSLRSFFPLRSADSGILKSGLTVRRQKKTRRRLSIMFKKSVGVIVTPKERESEASLNRRIGKYPNVCSAPSSTFIRLQTSANQFVSPPLCPNQ